MRSYRRNSCGVVEQKIPSCGTEDTVNRARELREFESYGVAELWNLRMIGSLKSEVGVANGPGDLACAGHVPIIARLSHASPGLWLGPCPSWDCQGRRHGAAWAGQVPSTARPVYLFFLNFFYFFR